MNDEERELLHTRFDALLNASLRLHRLNEIGADLWSLRRNQFEIIDQASSLLGDIFGDSLGLSRLDDMSETEYLEISVRVWLGAFGINESQRTLWTTFFRELRNFEFGDEPELLKPKPRKPGENQQPARLALARLTALEWDAFLHANGLRPSYYRPAIEIAYGTEWDAIRKWRKLIKNVYCQESFDQRVEFARLGYSHFLVYPGYLEPLRQSGQEYRLLVGLPEICAKDFNRKLENLGRDFSG